MKTPRASVFTRLASLAFGLGSASVLLPSLSLAQATTGFNQTGAGTYDYNDTANWVGGTINDINGVWDPSLVLLGAQTVTFGADTSLANGLAFNYSGAFNETLNADGTADHAITLGGDITVNTASANRTITIGGSTTNQKLNVDLGGGTRTFDVRGLGGTNNQRSLTFANSISNGALVLQGGGNINLSSGSATGTSLTALTLRNTHLNTNAFSDVTISGALTIDGAGGVNGGGNHGGIAVVTLAASSGRNHVITAGSLVRANNGVALFRGTSLGAAAPGTNNTTNITFTTAPTAQLVGGGGAAGSTTISILPWALGGTSTSTFDTFVTYDAANGIRPLNTTTEFAGSVSDGTATANNIRLAAGSGTTTINNATTVNSLYMVGDNTTATVLAGGGTLTVTSGAVFMTVANTSTTISANLNFGGAQGVFGYGTGKGSALTGAIAGSGGLVLHQEQQYATPGSPGTGVTISGNAGTSTYTGDTYVLGRVTVGTDGFLPSGSRSGDVYVYGLMDLSGGYTINGLNGTGNVSKASSGAVTLTLGDNNASGNFSGVLSNNGSTTLRKIGSGTQIFGGANTYTGGTQVNAGTLLVTNTTGSGTGTGSITVASGARFGGSGTATGAVTASAADSVIIAGGVSSIGTLNLSGGLAAASGATFAFDLNGASADAVNFDASTVTIGGTATFNFTSLGTVQTGSPYSLFSGSGDWSSVTSTFIFNSPSGYALDTSYGSGNGYVFDATNHSLTVEFTAIPEPSTYALLGASGVLLFAALRRRRR